MSSVCWSSGFVFKAVLFFFGGVEVIEGGAGAVEDHAGAAIAHDGADLFLHIGLVAMDAAVGAEGFIFHKGAMVASVEGVTFKGGAFGAEATLGMMVFLAV